MKLRLFLRRHVYGPDGRRPGYAFLLGVLAVGAITSATVVSLLLLGGAAEHTSFSLQSSLQAFEAAQSCVERGIYALRQDLTYAGGETFTVGRGTCDLLAIGGTGNGPRVLCAEGRSGDAVRRMEVRIDALFPSVKVLSWSEVTAFTLCSP